MKMKIYLRTSKMYFKIKTIMYAMILCRYYINKSTKDIYYPIGV